MKTALVTGASRGIGKAIALTFYAIAFSRVALALPFSAAAPQGIAMPQPCHALLRLCRAPQSCAVPSPW